MADPDLIIIKQWKKFVEINPTHSNFFTIGDGLGILEALKDHNAVYHKGCCVKVNDSHYNGLVKKKRKRGEKMRAWQMQRFCIKERRLNLVWQFTYSMVRRIPRTSFEVLVSYTGAAAI